MRVKLPSNGCMGIESVEIRQPRVNDLRSVSELPSCQPLAKTTFVKRLMKNPDELDRCSIYDKEYLFTIAAGVVNLNKVEFEYQCSCGEIVKGVFDLGIQDVVDLPRGTEKTYSKEIGGAVKTFSIPTVAQETKLCNYIIDNDLDFDEVFQDGMVCIILGNEPTSENISAVQDLLVPVYYGAVCFYQYAYHGVHCNMKCRCHKCGKETNVIVPVADQLLKVDTFSLMRRFTSLSNSVDFNSFKDLTIPELVALESSMKG